MSEFQNMNTDSGEVFVESRIATFEEITRDLTKIDLSSSAKIEKGGIVLYCNGNNKQAYVDTSDSHTLLYGATGSKKTRLVVLPTLQTISRSKESVVVTDPKGELFEKTAFLFQERGYDVIALNFREPNKGNHWNPLWLPYDTYHEGSNFDKASELIENFANTIIKSDNRGSLDPFWDSTATNFIFGLLMIMIQATPDKKDVALHNLQSLKSFFNTFESSSDGYSVVKNSFFEKLPLSSTVKTALSGTLEATTATRASIFATLEQHLRIFYALPQLSRMLSKSDFDMESIGTKPTAVFLIIPDEKSTFHKLASIFIKQCYESLIDVAQKQTDFVLPNRVNFILDEFSNLPTINDFPNMITAARSRNIRFLIVTQSSNQLISKYKSQAETIKSNCDNWIFLTSKELSLLQELSTLCGLRKISPQTNLMSVSRLQHLRKERKTSEALILCQRNYPFIATLADIEYYFECYGVEPYRIDLRQNATQLSFFNYKGFLSSLSDEKIQKLFIGEDTAVKQTRKYRLVDEQLGNIFDSIKSDDDAVFVTDMLIDMTDGIPLSYSDELIEAEKHLLQALILYLYHEAPSNEQNAFMLVELIDAGISDNSADESEDLSDLESSDLDRLFKLLKEKDEDAVALKKYFSYKRLAGNGRQTVITSCRKRFLPLFSSSQTVVNYVDSNDDIAVIVSAIYNNFKEPTIPVSSTLIECEKKLCLAIFSFCFETEMFSVYKVEDVLNFLLRANDEFDEEDAEDHIDLLKKSVENLDSSSNAKNNFDSFIAIFSKLDNAEKNSVIENIIKRFYFWVEFSERKKKRRSRKTIETPPLDRRYFPAPVPKLGEYVTPFERNIDRQFRDALQGNSKAQFELCQAFENGKDVAQDYAEAFHWLIKSANNGFVSAMYWAGCWYQWGRGVEKNLVLSFEWFTKAAEEGNEKAILEVGKCYWYGTGVKKSRKIAIEWLNKVRNNEVAKRLLAFAYAKGWGVKKNNVTAVELFKDAANCGDAIAQYTFGRACLGIWHLRTNDVIKVNKNIHEAEYFLSLASENGVFKAQTFLVGAYLTGKWGFEEDIGKAYKHFQLAKKCNNTNWLLKMLASSFDDYEEECETDDDTDW